MGSDIQEKTLLDYWLVLYRRKRSILVVVLSAILSAGFLSYLLPPIYEANTVFFVPAKPDTLTFLSPTSSEETKRTPLLPIPNKDQQGIYLGILLSSGLREEVSKKVGINFNRLKLDTDFKVSNEYLLELYTHNRNPKLAASTANKYVEEFNDFLDRISYNPISQKGLAIEKEMENIQHKLTEAENDLQVFQQTNRSTSINEEATRLVKEKIDLQMEIEKTQISLKEIDGKVAKIEELLPKEAGVYISSPLIASNPLVSNLQKQLSDLEASIAASKIELHDSHPDVLKLKAQYNERKKELEKEIEKIVTSEGKDPNSFHEKLRQQLVNSLVEKQSIQARATGLEETIKSLDKRIILLPELEFKMVNLERQVSLYRKTLDNLHLQLEETKAQERRKMQNIIVVSPAKVPESPVFPIPWLNMLVAGILGLIGGVFYCFFMDYVENVKDPERVWG